MCWGGRLGDRCPGREGERTSFTGALMWQQTGHPPSSLWIIGCWYLFSFFAPVATKLSLSLDLWMLLLIEMRETPFNEEGGQKCGSGGRGAVQGGRAQATEEDRCYDITQSNLRCKLDLATY